MVTPIQLITVSRNTRITGILASSTLSPRYLRPAYDDLGGLLPCGWSRDYENYNCLVVKGCPGSELRAIPTTLHSMGVGDWSSVILKNKKRPGLQNGYSGQSSYRIDAASALPADQMQRITNRIMAQQSRIGRCSLGPAHDRQPNVCSSPCRRYAISRLCNESLSSPLKTNKHLNYRRNTTIAFQAQQILRSRLAHIYLQAPLTA